MQDRASGLARRGSAPGNRTRPRLREVGAGSVSSVLQPAVIGRPFVDLMSVKSGIVTADYLYMRACEGKCDRSASLRRCRMMAGGIAALTIVTLGVFVLYSQSVRQLYWTLAGWFSR